jgi:glycosyltransferase involved in cell wall biosynthesis
MARILSIVWYKVLPAKFGGQKGIACFNEYLSKQFPLICLCSKNNESTDSLPYQLLPELPLNKWQFFNPLCWKKINLVVKNEKATHIILEHPYHGIAAYKAKKTTGAKLILHSHNIESERFRQADKWWWQILMKYEKWVHKKADLVLLKTGTDRDFAISHFRVQPEKCVIIPYGIEKKNVPDRSIAGNIIRKRHGIKPVEKILLFAATLDYEPNAKAVEHIYNEIATRLTNNGYELKIIICGRNKSPAFKYLSQFSHPAVINAGETEDIENYFAAADIFINPVQQGGGVQTKNIDALAFHCNLVCFENMIEKETITVAKEKIFTAPSNDWAVFVSQIEKAVAGFSPTHEDFFNYYDWGNIIQRLTERIDSI